MSTTTIPPPKALTSTTKILEKFGSAKRGVLLNNFSIF